MLGLSKSAALRWGQDRERYLLQHGIPKPEKEVPTLAEFWPRFLEGHARANKQKPSGIAAKEMIGRVHLLPLIGDRRLDAITTERVQGDQGRASGSKTQDHEQRDHRPEHSPEKGCGVGGDQSDAVCGSARASASPGGHVS